MGEEHGRHDGAACDRDRLRRWAAVVAVAGEAGDGKGVDRDEHGQPAFGGDLAAGRRLSGGYVVRAKLPLAGGTT